MLLPFSLVKVLPKIVSIYLKHLRDFALKFSGWGRVDSLLMPRKCLILLIAVIFNRFYWLYFLFIPGKINIFPRLKVNSKFICFILLSCKKVFVFERQVSRKKESSFKGHLLYSIRVLCYFQKISNIFASFRVLIHCVYARFL